MDKVSFSLAVTLLAMLCIPIHQTNAGEMVIDHPGILMPHVNLLGPSSDKNAGRLTTTVIASKRPITPLSSSTALSGLRVPPPVNAIRLPRSEPAKPIFIDRMFFAHPSKLLKPTQSKKRYNGYMKSQEQVNVWLDDLQIRLPGNKPVAAPAKGDHLVLHDNGRLEFKNKIDKTQAFEPGQLIPQRLLTLQLHQARSLRN